MEPISTVRIRVKAGSLTCGTPDGVRLLTAGKEGVIARSVYDRKAHKLELLGEAVFEPDPEQIDILIGTSSLPANIELPDGTEMQLGELVAGAFEKSGLTTEAWNALPGDERDALLGEHLESLTAPPPPADNTPPANTTGTERLNESPRNPEPVRQTVSSQPKPGKGNKGKGGKNNRSGRR